MAAQRWELIVSLQEPSDEHDWVRWFDDPVKYRGKVWDYKEEQWRVR